MHASSAYTYVQLPHAGLGNMLLVWARARVFADINNLPLIQSSWVKPRVGWLLRGEKHPRLYIGYFVSPSLIDMARKWWVLKTYYQIIDPEISQIASRNSRVCYVFRQLPHWSDFFAGLKEYRDQLRSHIYHMLTMKYRRRLTEIQAPVIGVHIRRGDFRELRANEDFANVGLVRTPLSYFCTLISEIRDFCGTCLPVTIFSDGKDHELHDVLLLPNVHRASANADIVDMLLFSRSKLLITSAGSSFSSWAVFLSDAPALIHPDHVHAPIRSNEINKKFFEGGVRGSNITWPDLLKQNIRNL